MLQQYMLTPTRPLNLVSKHSISSVTFVCDSQTHKSQHVMIIYS